MAGRACEWEQVLEAPGRGRRLGSRKQHFWEARCDSHGDAARVPGVRPRARVSLAITARCTVRRDVQGHYSRGNNASMEGKRRDFIAVLKQSSQDCPPILNALSQCDFTAFLMGGGLPFV